MIKFLNIQNFQSWRSGHFNFHPGINVIIGSSRAGKSAAMRALCWGCTNKPKGEAFRTWGSKETKVEIFTGDGYSIGRRKATSKNEYWLNGDGDDDEALFFKAFGQGEPPEEIQKALNLDPVNTQWQHDPPFLLSATSGEVARQLNRIANLSKIDTALSGIASIQSNSTQETKAAKKEIERLEEELASYDYLVDLESRVVSIEALRMKKCETKKQYDSALSLINEIERVERKLSHQPDTKGATELCRDLDLALTSLRNNDARMEKIRQLGGSITRTREKLEDAAELSAAKESVEEMIGWGEDLGKVKSRHKALADDVDLIYHKEAVLGELIDTLKEREALWEATAPDVCPLCEGKGRLKDAP